MAVHWIQIVASQLRLVNNRPFSASIRSATRECVFRFLQRVTGYRPTYFIFATALVASRAARAQSWV
jgi:succinate dehydrogenase/fumarate reductase cytochrome b subunit